MPSGCEVAGPLNSGTQDMVNKSLKRFFFKKVMLKHGDPTLMEKKKQGGLSATAQCHIFRALSQFRGLERPFCNGPYKKVKHMDPYTVPDKSVFRKKIINTTVRRTCPKSRNHCGPGGEPNSNRNLSNTHRDAPLRSHGFQAPSFTCFGCNSLSMLPVNH